MRNPRSSHDTPDRGQIMIHPVRLLLETAELQTAKRRASLHLLDGLSEPRYLASEAPAASIIKRICQLARFEVPAADALCSFTADQATGDGHISVDRALMSE